MVILISLFLILLLLCFSNNKETYKSISESDINKILNKVIIDKMYNYYNDIEVNDDTFFIDKRTNTFNVPYSIYLLNNQSNVNPTFSRV